MIRTIERYAAVILIGIIAILPLIVRILQETTGIQIPSVDSAELHFFFLFCCLAGVMTWREDRHLCLASVISRMRGRMRDIFDFFRVAVIVCILTALFLDALCQLVNTAQFTGTVWKISIRFFFAFLPLCYFGILIQTAREKLHLLACLPGLLVGLLIGSGPFTGILYYLTGIESVPFFTGFSVLWLTFSKVFVFPLILILILFGFFGVPLFLILGAVAYVLFSQGGGYVDVIPLETYRILTDRNIAAVPLFTIAGYILAQGSAGQRYVAVFKSLFGWFRGGTVVAAVVVATFFSTFTGVSGVTILALGSLLSVVLAGSGYSKDNGESLITASGAIGLLFPPSAAIIMFATTNYFSVDVFDLFKGALLPGVIMAIAMIGLGVLLDRQLSRPPFSLRETGVAIKNCIPELLLPLIISLLFFKGIGDLFEVAAFSVLYTFILSAVFRRDFGVRKSFSVVADSVPVSGGILFILGAASGISYFILDANVPALFSEYVNRYVTNRYLFLILMNGALLVVGCLMDMFSAILIVSPLLLPLAESFGLSPVHAGVIFLMNLSIGFLTPPVGMDLFISSYTFAKPLSKVIRGVFPFLLVQIGVLMLITYVPWFTSVL
jgi:C4-dicarboxylate transporter, DctM subunit